VRADGRLSILTDRVETPIGAGELVTAVRQRQAGNADMPVVVEADANVQYRAVMAAVNELQKAGVRRVGLAVVSAPNGR
jgi:biopolymer transport protein TolR